MKPKKILIVLIAVLAFINCFNANKLAFAETNSTKLPNIIFYLADDQYK